MTIVVLYFIGYILYFYRNMELHDYKYNGGYNDKGFKFGIFFICLTQSFFISFVWPYLIFLEFLAY